MNTVLLSGGPGSRPAEEIVRIPKPMMEIAGQPIRLHGTDIYSHFGQRGFILACRCKAQLIKRFFHDLHLMYNDFSVTLGDGVVSMTRPGVYDLHAPAGESESNTTTSRRLKKLCEWIGDETSKVWH